jgi:hypothetical protein
MEVTGFTFDPRAPKLVLRDLGRKSIPNHTRSADTTYPGTVGGALFMSINLISSAAVKLSALNHPYFLIFNNEI